jgi:hypothetical protein
MHEWLEPGALVRLRGADDWGVGQVQSVIGGRATVNFEHRGKVVVDLERADLELVFDQG